MIFDTGSGGYGFADTLSELMKDVENEYGDEVKVEVETFVYKLRRKDYGYEKLYYGMFGKTFIRLRFGWSRTYRRGCRCS